jgi:hypothetical protein
MIGMIEIPNKPAADSSLDRHVAHDLVASERTTQPCFGAKRAELAGCQRG